MNNENEYEELNNILNNKNEFSPPQSYNRANINFNVALSNPNLNMNDSMSLNIKDNSNNNMTGEINNNISSMNGNNNISSMNGNNNISSMNRNNNISSMNRNNDNTNAIDSDSNNLNNISVTTSTINDKFNNQTDTNSYQLKNDIEKETTPIYNIDVVPEVNNYLYSNKKEDLRYSNLMNDDNNSGERLKTTNISKNKISGNYKDLKFFVLITLIIFIVIMFFSDISKFFSDLIYNR